MRDKRQERRIKQLHPGGGPFAGVEPMTLDRAKAELLELAIEYGIGDGHPPARMRDLAIYIVSH